MQLGVPCYLLEYLLLASRLRADLHLEGLHAHQHGGVQRSVAVGLGRRDVVLLREVFVLERARQRRPHAMHLAERVVAEGGLVCRGGGVVGRAVLCFRVEEHHAQRDQVEEVLNRALVALQLLPGRVDRLGAPRHAHLVRVRVKVRVRVRVRVGPVTRAPGCAPSRQGAAA
eukprot:scaffold90382_cov78-Phaeocystis_antarctica.AAC.2